MLCPFLGDFFLSLDNYLKHIQTIYCMLLLQVMSVKAVGIAIKLTIEGSSQAASFQTWVFVMVAITCIITQLNYLNKVSAYISSFFASIFSFSGFLKFGK